MPEKPIFTPNRAQRRQLADRPCSLCLKPLSSDVLGVSTDDAVLWLHGACVRTILSHAETENEES